MIENYYRLHCDDGCFNVIWYVYIRFNIKYCLKWNETYSIWVMHIANCDRNLECISWNVSL